MDGELAGLALVKKGSELSGIGKSEIWQNSSFFADTGEPELERLQRRRCGPFSGVWEVRVMQSNLLANSFWESAISHFTGVGIQPVRVEKDGQNWQLFSLESKYI
jgi:hypothetical protein